MEGDTFIANCTSNDANPAKIDDVYWKDSADNRVAETQDLVLENVTRGRKGEYTCVMSNTFYNGKRGRGSASIKIHVHCSPNITTIDTIFCAGIGEVVEIVCEVDSFPAPTIMWYDNSSNAITNDDDNIQTTLGDSGELRRSTLTITVVDESYYGIYTCKAFNNIPPNATSTVKIIKQDSSLESSSFTIVAVAAASGAVFLIALAVVIALCWHRRNSNKQRRESSSTIPSPAMPSTAAESSDILDGEGERYVICTSKGGDEEKSNSYQNVLELTESSRDQIIDQNRVKGGTDAGLQNSTTKAELTYAELDLTDSGSGQQRFKRDPREKTQYAQIQISKGKGKNRKRK
ncbi:junctional adhesion molecule A-like [Ptychodera flava]|uniref:junctional adhesion molecule A-like n=1 Tax=Ptychodera flava TaxID=63121 RepID=UPI003969C825